MHPAGPSAEVMRMTRQEKGQEPASGRQPYERPVLRIFGTVTDITASVSMDGKQKDGGPNNLKT
jgi:hypothetical protein